MQVLDTIYITSTTHTLYLKLHRDLSILIAIPSGIVYQLQQFAIDNHFTGETGFPEVASVIHEIYSIIKVPKTEEEFRFLVSILGFPIRKEVEEKPDFASIITEAVLGFLAMHKSPGMEEIRDLFEVTTLDYVNFCLACGISNYIIRKDIAA